MALTAIILTKNEEASLAKALTCVAFADEVLVVDDLSTDTTLQIAKKHRATVISRSSNADFAAQRTFAEKRAKGEWILFVDADEYISPKLAQEIKDATRNTKYKTYYIKRRDFWWGKELKHGETRKARTRGFIRLYVKGSGLWHGRVHEVFLALGTSGRLSEYLDHYPHPTLKEFIQEVNYYSTIRAKELWQNNKSANILELLFVPPAKFIYTYIILLGFLDGVQGFIYSFMMSFHSFLVRAKLYQYRELT